MEHDNVLKFDIIPDSVALTRCTCCRSYISDEMEVFAAGVKIDPEVDLSQYESHCIQIGRISEETPVYMMVTAEGSEAKEDGKDGMLLFCSEACGRKMKDVLEKEISIGAMFGAIQFE